ncbi:MAG: TonB-dependent receptor [Bacteroidales bacterium]
MLFFNCFKAGGVLSFGFVVLLPLGAMSQMRDSTKLTEKTIRLSEVKVAATLPLTNNKVVDFYRTNHFATLDNINARLDGMSLIKRGAYALEPQLNGFSGGQLNVTIDGMKLFGACTDKMDPITSYIEPTNLNKISVKQGTSGCENGCTVGGTVDMTLQEPDELTNRPFFLDLGAGYETNANSRNLLLSTGFSSGKWAMGIDGVVRNNDNYRDGTGRIVPFSQFRKTNLHSVLRYKADSVSTYKADLLIDDASNVGYPALPMDVSLAQAYLFALEYRRKGDFPFRIKAYVNTIRHVMDDSQRDSLYHLKVKPEGKPDSVYMRMDMPGRSTTFGAFAETNRTWSERNKLLLKVDNYTNQSIAEMTMHMHYPGFPPERLMYMQTWPEMLRNVSGIFAQNTTFISQDLALTVNGRLDFNVDVMLSDSGRKQFSVFGYNLPNVQSRFVKSANVIAQYQLLKSLSVTATVGYSERMPTIGERLGYYLYVAYDGYDYIGNPNIRTEKSNFARLQLQWTHPVWKVNFSQSYSYVTDYILGQNDAAIPPMNFYAKGIRVYTNLPAAKLYSADLQLLCTPSDALTFFWNSKYTRGEMSSGSALPLMAPLKNVLAVQYKIGSFMLQAEGESALAQHRINADYGEKATPGYAVANAKCSYEKQLHHHSLRLSVGVSNLFDRAYYEHLDWGRINRPGRSVDLYVGYGF